MSEWVRSSFCSTNSCIEVQQTDGGVWIAFADEVATFVPAAEWAAFIAGVKAGEFDD